MEEISIWIILILVNVVLAIVLYRKVKSMKVENVSMMRNFKGVNCVPFGGDASKGNCCPGLYPVNGGGGEICACAEEGFNPYGTPCCQGLTSFSSSNGDYCLDPTDSQCSTYCEEACAGDNTCMNSCMGICNS